MKMTNLKLNGLSLLAGALALAGCSKQSDSTPETPPAEPAAEVNADASAGDVCAAHGAPKELCFICDASLREKGRLWCQEHGRYEDRCWLCHPELEDKDRLYCKEHSLYEDECFLCHPEFRKGAGPEGRGAGDDRGAGDSSGAGSEDDRGAGPEGRAAGEGAAAGTPHAPQAAGLFCQEHRVPEAECGICHPDLLAQKPVGQGLKVRLPSTESAGEAGVLMAPPTVNRIKHGVECFAELTFDQNNLTRITTLADGIVRSVEVDLGSRVKEGEVLAHLTSVAVGEAQGAYLRALAENRLRERTLARERNLRAQRITSEQDFQEAEAAHEAALAAVQEAKQRLLVLGFEEDQIQQIAGGKGKPGVLEIHAPIAGEIVERTAVPGAMAEAGRPLFTLVNTGKLWAMVSIPESQLSRVEVGQTVALTVESLPGWTFPGKLTWLASQVDARTRMARGRVEVDNASGRLKAQMFAQAHIITSSSDRAVVVPQSAVQNVTGTPVVFVRSADDLFEARPVRVGARHNGHIEITAGLNPDEPVAVAGTFALKSQLLISRLGAGCVD